MHSVPKSVVSYWLSNENTMRMVTDQSYLTSDERGVCRWWTYNGGVMGVGMMEGISRASEVPFSSGNIKAEKNGEISKNVTSEKIMCRWSWRQKQWYLFLYIWVALKDTFESFCRNFVFTWTEVMNKACVAKDTERNGVEIILRV